MLPFKKVLSSSQILYMDQHTYQIPTNYNRNIPPGEYISRVCHFVCLNLESFNFKRLMDGLDKFSKPSTSSS